MALDRDQLRAALASPRTDAARDAALVLGATGTLDDVAVLERARAAADVYYRELAAQRSGGDAVCGTSSIRRLNEAWAESVGPFAEALALLQVRLHPDGGVAALVSEGCTVSLLADHIGWHDDLDLFVRLLAVLSRDRGAAHAVAFREVSRLAGCSRPIWSLRGALAVGGWGTPELFADLSERFDAAHDVAIVYGWKPQDRRAADLLAISLAFGRARSGRWDDRFLAPALSAISAAADPRIAALLEGRLADAPASAGRDQLQAALRRCR